MTEHKTTDHGSHGHGDGHGHGGHHHDYVKIWAILVVLLVISVVGPFLEILWVTLITAFGIAIVKAYIVAKYFMHVNVQPKYVAMFLTTALAFMGLFWAGVAPDVMKHEGTQWENVAAKEHIQKALEENKQKAAQGDDQH